jgi:DNA (cytosine-5)-methyltransferase 1
MIDEAELIIDNFAGGGGASTGIALALGRGPDIAINHDPVAIAMHEANHPHTKHYTESVWDVDPIAITNELPVGLAWFSPDCTHFSGAKGGKPVDKGIRGLAWVAVKWATLKRPRVQMLENVPEFKTWGPLTEGPDGKMYPDKKRKGETFNAFIACLTTGLDPDHPAWEEIRETLGPGFPYERLEHGLGYQVEWKELRACDFGAPTIRKRLFIVMRCDGRPIVWPEPTHGDPKSKEVQSGKLLPWRTAAEIIDWSIPCPSIFERKRPLKEATLRRIARGIQKFVIDSPEPFIVPVTHQGADRVCSINAPIPTVTGANRGEFALISPTLIQTGYGEREGQAPRVPGLDKPLGTVVAGGQKHAVVTAYLDRQFTRSVGQEADAPVGTVTAGGSGKTNLVAAFLSQYNTETPSHFARGQDLDTPLYTVPTANRYGLVAASLVKHYGGGYTGPGNGVEEPVSTVTATDHNSLVTSHLIKLRGTCAHGQRVDEPMPTVTSGGLHIGEVRAFLVKYFSTAVGQSLKEPLHTATAKARFGLVTIHGEDYQIVDIGMRMLKPRELYDAQGFPKTYIIDVTVNGKRLTLAEQVDKCGNAVPPAFSRALVMANLPEMCEQVAA